MVSRYSAFYQSGNMAARFFNVRLVGTHCGGMTDHRNPLTAMSDYTIYLTEAEAEWIAKHKEETGAGSRSRVIRDALEHYRQAVENNTAEASQ